MGKLIAAAISGMLFTYLTISPASAHEPEWLQKRLNEHSSNSANSSSNDATSASPDVQIVTRPVTLSYTLHVNSTQPVNVDHHSSETSNVSSDVDAPGHEEGIDTGAEEQGEANEGADVGSGSGSDSSSDSDSGSDAGSGSGSGSDSDSDGEGHGSDSSDSNGDD
jgi:hypothetical protein